jgi:hypothetical protein
VSETSFSQPCAALQFDDFKREDVEYARVLPVDRLEKYVDKAVLVPVGFFKMHSIKLAFRLW